MTQASASSGTRGFLFSDLRGYTAFVESRGDQAAAELLATYRALVRTVIARHDGAEIKTEGDSVYVVFPNASAAVEAGLEILAGAAEQSTPTRPIRVGVGVHAGETVATTEGLVGGAVNIAARVCAKAQAGEVLVTDTVRALTRTYLPYRYTSLGTQQLKGIAGGIPLFRVEVSPSTRSARLRRQLSARRGRVLIVAGLLVVLLAVGAGVYDANRAPDCLTLPASTKDVVAKIDPARNCVVAVYPVGRRPAAIASAGSGMWVANLDDWTVTSIDLPSGSSVSTGTGGAPTAIVTGPNGDAYVLLRDDRTVGVGETHFGRDRAAKIGALTRQVQETRMLPEVVTKTSTGAASYSAIAFSSGQLWIPNSYNGDIAVLRFGSGLVTVPVVGQGLTGPGAGSDRSMSGVAASGSGMPPRPFSMALVARMQSQWSMPLTTTAG